MSTNISVNGGTIINIRKNPDDNNIIEYSLNDTSVWNTISFPCYITNTNTNLGYVKIYFITEINITSTSQYFICNSNNVQFGSDSLNPDGTRPIINVKINNYPGFIDNSNNNMYSNILIYNLYVNGIDSHTTHITETNAGWITRNYFKGSNNYIINCSSNGNIGISGGGIVGANAASSINGSLYIIGCSSSGTIGNSAGGIIGINVASGTNALVSVNSCWSSGSISGTLAGGIVGENSYNCQITNCYSTGEISGSQSGGICGQNTGIVNCIITNCYSTGVISGLKSGGICTSNTSCNITISNCYTTGNNAGTDTGGILGYFTVTGTRIIRNCYVVGSSFTTGHVVSGYIGDANYISVGLFTIQNCYSETYHSSGIWHDLNAIKCLTGIPSSSPGVGNSWVSIVTDTPYYIFNMGYTPYSNNIINNNSLVRTYSSSFISGASTDNAIKFNLSYKKLIITGGDPNSYDFININNYTGTITTTRLTSGGDYTIYISNNSDTIPNSSLYFTTYSLNIISTLIFCVGGTIINIRQNDNNLEYSLNQENIWKVMTFYFIITNTDTTKGFVKIDFNTNIDITDTNQYFICNSNNIQFGSESLNPDGTRPIINIKMYVYDGFIDNSSGYSNILIFNLFINAVNNGIIYLTSAGWIAGNNFKGSNNYIINCSSNGNIINGGGVIVGANAASDGGSLYIIGCSSSGNIGTNASGIVGNGAGINNGQVYINSCWSSGTIGFNAGGIIGGNSSNCQIINCYSTGNISGGYTGGIIGPNSNNCTIQNCYSTGEIKGYQAGGICAYLNSDNTVNIENCYTTGVIYNQNNAGGILGTCSINNPSANKRIIKNCYVSGSINTSNNKGYIVGGQTDGDNDTTTDLFTIENCYSEAYNNTSGWNDSHANTVLLGTPTSLPGVGDFWVSIVTDTSYRIFNMGYTPYSSKIIDKDENNEYYLIKTYSSSVVQGEFSTNAIISSLSYQKLKITDGNSNSYNSINIDINSGKIITSPSTIPEIYNIYISNIGYNNSLYFTTYSLTVVANIYIDGNNIIYIRKNPDDNNIIEYSLNDTSVWNTIYFPCNITNTNTNLGYVKVYFTTDINITDITQYFICNSNKIQFGSDSLKPDGTRPIINVTTNYGGFIDNSSGYSNILIFNLSVNAKNGATTYITLDTAGWIARNNFNGSNNYIINCSSNGDISNYGGGIVGANAASYGGSLYIIGCSSSGKIGRFGVDTFGGGGIVGDNAGYNINSNYGEVIIKFCRSSGPIIGEGAGGIIGKNSYKCQITGCFSKNPIFKKYTGGIAGNNSGIVYCTIKNCHSIGSISGENSGGICGFLDQDNTITIENCYTTGEISNYYDAGGILGSCNISNPSANKRIIKNCYAAGQRKYLSYAKGYIVGGQPNGGTDYTNNLFTIINCYSETYHNKNGWNYSNANTVLLGTPTYRPGIGSSWVSIDKNVPYYIFNMGYTPYSNKIIDKDENNQYYLIKTYSSSVIRGEFSTDAIRSGLSYRILQITNGNSNSYNSINIDINSGKIITSPSTIPEIYDIYIGNEDDIGFNNSFYSTTYSLTVVANNIFIDGNNIIYIRQNQSSIEYSINPSDLYSWIVITFSCSITNTNTELGFVKVYFTTEINITDINQYFVCNSDKIQFGSDSLNQDGTIPTINVNINNYGGFIDNNFGYNDILIFNLLVNGINGETTYSTAETAGWIARNNFKGSNNYIINCFSNGNINTYGGGIVGANAVSNGGSLYIIGCSSSGIIGHSGGGIVGFNVGYDSNSNYGVVSIESCWSSGSLTGDDSGGIVGKNSYNCQITSCYSTGNISGSGAGGIVGSNSGVVSCTIKNCYSIGNISGENSGGICGRLDQDNIITIENCYTTGVIYNQNNAGGISGYWSINTPSANERIIKNCYVSGSINTSNNKGYIIGGQTDGDNDITNNLFTIDKCYSEAYHNNYEWKDTNANKVLLETPTSLPGFGNSWVLLNPNTPYYIFNMGYTPYSNKIIDKNANNEYYLIKTYSSSVIQGDFSNAAIISSLFYKKFKITSGNINSYNSINIDVNSGEINTTPSTFPVIYNIYMHNNGYNNSLYFSIYSLTVNSLPKIIYTKNLFTDNSLIYYKPHTLSCSAGTVKNYRIKQNKT